MKKGFVIITWAALFLLFSTSAFGFGNIDGHTWNEWKVEEKEVYILGLIDGINLGIVLMGDQFQDDMDLDLLATQLEREGALWEIDEEKDEIKSLIDALDEELKERPDKTVFDLLISGVFQL